MTKFSAKNYTNDTKRKEFLENYQEWDRYYRDSFNHFDYFLADFGTFEIRALEYTFKSVQSGQDLKKGVILTLCEPGKPYVPVLSTQSSLIESMKRDAYVNTRAW